MSKPRDWLATGLPSVSACDDTCADKDVDVLADSPLQACLNMPFCIPGNAQVHNFAPCLCAGCHQHGPVGVSDLTWLQVLCGWFYHLISC